MIVLSKIISGGQTGADRGGLEAGRELGLATGGWVPSGWRTELGSDPTLASFGCKMHWSATYPPRTEANVRDSDGTLVFGNPRSPGCTLTVKLCAKHGKPLFMQTWKAGQEMSHGLVHFGLWLDGFGTRVLNVAGNRESKNPGICAATRQFIVQAVRSREQG